MKYITICLNILILSLPVLSVHAVTIQECVDENNETTYQETCPPGSTSANTLKLKTGKPAKAVGLGAAFLNITFYSIPECDSCNITRSILERHGATFTEENIQGNVELQEKLRKLLGSEGPVSVPTVIFGEKQIVGFDRETLTKELEAAGYMDKAKEAEKAEKAKQQAENESEGVADDEVEAESEAIEDTASAEEAY